MQDYKLILFDVGGVLINYSNAFVTASKELNIPVELLDATYDKYEREVTAGKMTPQDLYISSLKDNGLKADENYDFLKSWIKDYSSITPTFNLVLDLEGKYNLGLLSNIYTGTLNALIKQNLIPNIKYVHTFLSCDMGMQKPDKEIYEKIIEITKLAPDDILFIDDRDDYLSPPKAMGWNTFKFDKDNPEVSVSALRKLLL